MKPRQMISRNQALLIICICTAIFLLLVPAATNSLAASDTAPEALVRDAWQQAGDIGAYQFDSTIEQTTYPAPAIANVGRSSETQTYYLQGAVDREAEMLSMMVWQNSGSLLTGQDGFEMHVQDGKAYGREIGGAWQEIDNFSGLFAPGSDPMAYLAGAVNLQPAGVSGLPAGGTSFSFDIDGPAFASYLRVQLEDQLRRTGELPYGLSLDTPRAYREMSGTGQVWLDEDGLPLRLQVDLDFPDAQTGEQINAAIRTDFAGFQRQPAEKAAFKDNPLGWAAAALGILDSPDGWTEFLSMFGFWLLLGALLALLVIYRHSRRVYAAIVGAVIVSMVLTPLLQSQQVSAYYERQEASETDRTSLELQESADDLLGSEWDPHQEPVSAGDAQPAALDSTAAVEAVTSADAADTDLDGLIDDLETVLGTDLTLADSDADQLSDGTEYLRLGTDPLAADSDGDGIRDNVEAAGFQYNGQYWYLDPNSADSNRDGRIDMIECPDLVGLDSPNGDTCLDQDADGTPDVFDRDDDGDGLADSTDLYPDGLVDQDGLQSNGLDLDYFDSDQPFKFKVQSLQSDYPVLVDFQLVPEDRDHLTYALNVLDWPGSDTDGQVQHVKNTTFASEMTDTQVQSNPSAAYGDMRLVPMLEIVMTGSQVPLPLTEPSIEIALEGDFPGELRLEQNAADRTRTDMGFSFDEASADYTVKIYEGGCPVSGSALTTINHVGDGDTRTYSQHIVDLSDGNHAITISDGSAGDCASLGNIVNGPYRNQMVDPEPLQIYGISVREINKNGKLAAYVPVNMVPDETGSGRAAFSARMLYQVGTSASWQKEQEVRLVWLVQMLTDGCDTSGFTEIVGEDETSAADRLQTWCAAPSNRSADGFQVVHTYDDSWVLTGMSVREDHGLDTAIIYEDPSNGDVANSENLWQAAYALSAAFVAGRDDDGDAYRDVSVYTYDPNGGQLGNTNIYNRLDASGNIPDGDDRRWGIDKGALQVERERYPHQDYLAYQAMTDTPEILDNYDVDDIPTLLFAREEHARAADLRAVSLSGGVFNVDMSTSSHPEETITGLRWMPYRYNSGTDPDGQVIGWETYPAAEYWDRLEIQYQDLFAGLDADQELDEDTYMGQAVVARAYYLSLLQGLAQQINAEGELTWIPDPNGDSDAALVAGITIGFGKKIESIVYSMTVDFLEEYGRSLFIEVAFDKYNNVYTAIYEEVHGFWYSIGKSIKANTVGPWMELFSGGVKSKIGAGIALAGGVAIIGLTLFAVSQQSSGAAAAEVALAGLSVVMAIQGLVSTTLRVIKAVDKFGSFSAAMRGNAASISANAKNSISKAAIVGLIIGVVITWGTVALMIGLQAGAGGGISGTAIANAIAGAIASTVVAIIMFAIAAIPVVGWIIGAVVGIIDSLVSMLCTIFVPDDQEDHPAVSWFCGGLTGIVTQALTVLVYSGNQMVNLVPEDYNRLEFSDFQADDLVHPDWGISQGNSIRYGVAITNTIDIAPLPDNIGAGYRYQYNDGTLRSSTFDYQLSYTNTVEIHDDLDRNTMSDDWVYMDGDGPEWGDFGHTWHAAEPVYVEQSVKSEGIELSQAGINQPASLYLTEGYAVPTQNCILGVCTIWTERSSEHYDLGSAILLDVFPATLTDFYQLTVKTDGYALAWGQDGSDTFPRLEDADGDGIPYYADQHDNTWDNDGDTLSDSDEARLGTNPDDGDSDNDGLRDDLELIAGSNPVRPDSDGDGLVDGEEVFHQDQFDQDGDGNTSEWLGGWTFAYGLDSSGALMITRVFPSPLNGDSDGDTLTDYQEKVYGMNPLRTSNPNVLTFESTLLEEEGSSYATSDGYVQPGDTLIYDASLRNELYNRWMHGLLGTEFPVEFSSSDITPEDFLLYPQEEQTLSGEVAVSGDADSGAYNLTQSAGALVFDWGELSQDAALWYPFEDDSDVVTFADRSGSLPAHDGDCSNPVSGQGCIPVKDDGAFGGSLRLDGSAYVTAGYDPSDTEYAVSLWFKTTQSNGALFSALGPTGLDRQIVLNNGQVRATLTRNTTTQTVTSSETYNDNQWHHLVHTFGAAIGGQRLYLDGVLVDSGNMQRVSSFVSNIIAVGHTTSSLNDFNGRIDDLRIYDRALGHAEIEVLFGSPVLDLRFNSDSGWKDSSPFKNTVDCSSGNCPSHSDGIDGKAADFGGMDYLSVGADDSLDLSDGQFTIGAWIYPDNTPQYCYEREWLSPDCAVEEPQPQGIFGLGSGGDSTYPTLQRVGRRLRFTFGDNDYFTTGDVLRANRWSHVAVTFDGSALKIFVNGELTAQDSTTFDGQTPPSRARLTIGRSGSNAVLKAKKIRVAGVGEGEHTGELCMAFLPQNESTWVSLLDRDIDEGLVDGNYMPLLININTEVDFNNGGTLLLWENDTNPRCITNDNEDDSWPVNGYDDFLYTKTFSTWAVSEGVDGPEDENYAQFSYTGAAEGFVYYVYENDSIPFQGRIDEFQIYNRPLDETGIAEMYQAHRMSLYLKLDDAPGATSFADASFDPQQATCSGANCPTAGVAGRVNQAAYFDGSDSLSLGKSELNRLTGELTVAAWVRPETLSGLQWIAASARTNSANGYGLALDGGGLRFQAFGVDTYTWPAAGLTAGEWAHVAAVMDEDNDVSFYVNGVLLGTDSGSGVAIADTDDVFLIGAGTAAGSSTRRDFFHGEIDDIYIYSNALGNTGIQSMYQRAPFVQLHLDEGIHTPNSTWYDFEDAADPSYSAHCQGDECPQFGEAIDGQLGTAVEFDGVDNKLTYGYRTGMVLSQFSLSAWVYPTQVKDGWQTIATRGYPEVAYGLFIQPDSMIPAFIGGNSSCAQQTLLSENPLVQNTWNHLTAVMEDGEMKLYLNGQIQGTREARVGACNQSAQLVIGGQFSDPGSAAFSGRIDEVAFYTQPLTWSEIAEIYSYQAKWVEERQSHTVTVDDDLPVVELTTTGDYLPLTDIQMLITAVDATSGVDTVELGVRAPGASTYTWKTVPQCQDSPGATAWCPTFDPAVAGTYSLRARVTDQVGHISRATAEVTVDNSPPSAGFGFAADGLFTPVQDDGQMNAWRLLLSGTVSDPSGVDADSLTVVLLDSDGLIVSPGAQRAALSGNDWATDLLIQSPEPGGEYTVQLTALDAIAARAGLDETQQARHTQVLERAIQLDASPPSPSLDWSGIPSILARGETISGSVTDNPAAVALSIDVDDAADELGLTLTCAGELRYRIDNGQLPARVDTFAWNGDVHRGSSCSLTLTDSGGDGGTSGSVSVCGEQVAAWNGVFIDEYSLDFNANAAACGATLDSAGIAAVETALISQLPGSTDVSLTPFADQWLHLSLDEAPSATESLYFRDTSGLGFDGVCGGDCPDAAQAGHTGSAVFFDGLDDEVRVEQGEDLGDRSQLSISLWLRPTGESAGVFLYKADEFALRRDPDDGHIEYQLGNTNPGWNAWMDSGVVVPEGEWTHFALAYDGSQVYAYANGQLINTQAGSGAIPNLHDVLIGSGNGKYFRGLIDEVRVFWRALSAGEIGEIYRGVDPVLQLTLEDGWVSDGARLPDQSGWEHDGVFNSGESDPLNKAASGQVGAYALDFDGVDDYALVADSPALDVNQFSISLWVNADHWVQSAAFHPLLVKGSADNGQVNYGLYLDQQNGNLSLRIDDATCSYTTYFPSTQNLMPGAWNHVVATYDGSEVVLYVNLQEAWRAAYTGGACQNDQPVRLGQALGGSIPAPIFSGMLDDIFIYPRALSIGDVNSLYARGWQAADTVSAGAGVTRSEWSADIPDGLEGVYRIDLRARDVNGNVSRPQSGVWQGDVDTRAPRLTLDAELLGDTVRYTTTAEDFNLAGDGLVTPCGAGFDGQSNYFRAEWYQALLPTDQRQTGLTAVCETSSSALPGEVGATDTPGLARSVVISDTFAYLADSEAGLQIVDFSNPVYPQIIASLSAGYATDIAIAESGPVLWPDLLVASLEPDPASPVLGETFTISVTVQNQGQGQAPGFEVALYQDAQPAACQASASQWTASVPQLQAGQSVVVAFSHPGLTNLDPHDFYVQVDSGCAFIEADEANNIFGPVAITAVQPDLVVESMTVEPTSIYESEPLTVTVAIRNQGTGTAENFRTSIYSDTYSISCGDAGWGFEDATELAPGATAVFTFVHPGFAQGAHSLLSAVDSGCAVTESDENNNIATDSFTVLPPAEPDLVVTNIQASNTAPLIDESFVVTVTVHNQGDAPTGEFDAAIFNDYEPLACGDPNMIDWSRVAGGLAAGASTQVIFNHAGFSTPGLHYIVAQADSACEIVEPDEANTSFLLYIDVIDPNLPDLVINDLAVPASTVVGESYVVTTTVTNQGLGTAVAPYDLIGLAMFVNRSPQGCDAISDGATDYNGSIAPGETVIITTTMAAPSFGGMHNVYAFIDGGCGIDESNENNNTFGPVVLDVTGGAPSVELVIGSATAAPYPVTAGDPITITVRVDNIGTLVAGAFEVGIFTDTVPISTCLSIPWASQTIPELAASTSANVTFSYPGLTTPGTHTFYAMVDSACAQTEFNEGNNNDSILIWVDAARASAPASIDEPVMDFEFTGDTGGEPAAAAPVERPEIISLSADGPSTLAAADAALFYAFITEPNGLRIVYIDDPAAPVETASLSLPGTPRGVALNDEIAYLATQSAGLHAVDVSNPGYPGLLDSLALPGRGEGVAVSGGYAFVAAGVEGLHVVDIADPSNLQLVGSYDTHGYAYHVAVEGAFAYVADGGEGLQVIDITDPADPQYAGELDTYYLAKGITLSGTQAYLADGTGGLGVLDISDPASPVLLRTFDTPGSVESVALGGGFALVADYDAGLRVINPSGEAPRATACDLAGNCATTSMEQSFAALADMARSVNPLLEIDYPYAEGPLVVAITNLPPVLDSMETITVTGYASTTLTTLDTLTVTVDGAPLVVQGWSSGAAESDWSAQWTPAADGSYRFQAEVSDADGTTASTVLSVTVDTLAPNVNITPGPYTGQDYHEPRSINLQGEAFDTGGVTRVEVLGLDGTWRQANLLGDDWWTSWPLGDETLPDNRDYVVQVRATDIAGHTAANSETITVDVLPPAPVDLTLSSGGAPLEAGDILPSDSATLTLDWTASSDGGGLATEYQVAWTAQVTSTAQQSGQSVPTTGPLTADFNAHDGEKIAVRLGMEDAYGNQRWQDFGSIFVDSPLTPDYIPLALQDASTGKWTPVYRGWMGSGCTDLGVERRIDAASYGQEQQLYVTWDERALRLAWLGADWDSDGDLFIYLDTTGGGTSRVYDPFGSSPPVNVGLPDGMLADAIVWVQDRSQAVLLRWNGNGWDSQTLSSDRYQWSLMAGTSEPVTDLYLPFDPIGLAAGGSLDMVAFATMESALDLWAALPQGNLLNGAPVTDYRPADGENGDFDLTHSYHWDAVTSGICPNGSDHPESSTAFPDADLQAGLQADPAGVGYSLFGEGLYWLQDELTAGAAADISSQMDFLVVDQPPLPNDRDVTYTLEIYNRGLDTAYDVQAEIDASFTLMLLDGDPAQQTRSIGDIAPGNSVTLSLHGRVDTGRSTLPWARLAVRIYDAAHPTGSDALEYLWIDHPVDREGPLFSGLTQPDYLLGTGENWLAGYAYDDVGIQAVEVQAQGQGTETLNCPVDDPTSGDWGCLWNVSGQNGDLFHLSVLATDEYNQSGVWSTPQTFMLDTQAPVLSLDESALPVTSGSLVRSLNFSLIGSVTDNGGLGQVDVCLGDDCQLAALTLDAGQQPVVVDDVPAASIPIDASSACSGGGIVRTFGVAEDMTVGDIRLGFSALHTRRDDLRVVLTAPSGLTTTLLTDDGLSGTDYRNVDLWLDDAAPASFADRSGDHLPAPPYYAYDARPAHPLQSLAGASAQGTWTLSICDTNPGSDDGAYLRSQLVLTPQDPYAKSGRWSAQVRNAAEMDYVPQEITVYGEDLIGNRTATPLHFDVIVDNVAPGITVEQALTDGHLGQSGRVLAGTLTEGGPSTSLWVNVLQPNGETLRVAAARQGDDWTFDMDYDMLGEYQFWLTAIDLAGNTTVEGVYTFNVMEKPVLYFPMFMLDYAGRTVYESDFDDAVGGEWSQQDRQTAPNGEVFLGPFNNDDLTFDLGDLPPHSQISIAFDLYIIRSWDGNQVVWPPEAADVMPMLVDTVVGPDVWTFQAGGQTLLETTFSNWTGLPFNQAYPDAYPGGDHPAQTGAAAVNTLGYYYGEYQMDATYHLEFTFDHCASDLQSGFSASSLQIDDDETWGIDNVEVTIVP